MILESKWLLSGTPGAGGAIAGQTLTGTSAIISTNVVDLGLGAGNKPNQAGYTQDDLYIAITAKVASGGTTPGLTATVQTATDAAFTTPVALGNVTVGALKEGDVVLVPVPQSNLQFLRLSYLQTGTAPTNTVVAALTNAPQQWVSTPDALVGL